MLFTLLVVAVGEEAGWRGWMLPELQRFSPWLSSVLPGFVWSLWHLLLFLNGQYDDDRVDPTIAIPKVQSGSRACVMTAPRLSLNAAIPPQGDAAMTKTLIAIALLAAIGSTAANANPEQSASQAQTAATDQPQTLPQVDAFERRDNSHSLRSTLDRGINNTGLTMQEKWSHDVMVCKDIVPAGTRIKHRVCHSRAEWQAMRGHGAGLARTARR